MNIFGIGTMELAVIFLVAIIALGPGKTMETARTLGRIMREARRTFTEVMDAASLNDTDPARRPDADHQERNAAAAGPPADAPRRPPATPLPPPAHLADQQANPQQASPENTAESPNPPDGSARPAD